MKLLIVAVAAVISTASLARASDTCKLVGETKGTKTWQCPPTPVSNAAPVGGQQMNPVPENDKK